MTRLRTVAIMLADLLMPVALLAVLLLAGLRIVEGWAWWRGTALSLQACEARERGLVSRAEVAEREARRRDAEARRGKR